MLTPSFLAQSLERYGDDVTITLPLRGTVDGAADSQTLTPPPSPFGDTNFIQDPSFENATAGIDRRGLKCIVA
jgi:hypothetical protein